MVPYWSWPPLSMVRRRQPTWIRRMTITTAAWHWTRRRRRRRPMFRIHAPCLRHIASRCLFTQCGYIPAYCRRQIHGCPRCCPLSAKLHAHTLYRGEQSLLSFSTPSNRIVLLTRNATTRLRFGIIKNMVSKGKKYSRCVQVIIVIIINLIYIAASLEIIAREKF